MIYLENVQNAIIYKFSLGLMAYDVGSEYVDNRLRSGFDETGIIQCESNI